MSEGEGFQIRDRRRVTLEGKLKDEYDEKIKPEPEKSYWSLKHNHFQR
jgi:hypothetical protein